MINASTNIQNSTFRSATLQSLKPVMAIPIVARAANNYGTYNAFLIRCKRSGKA
jgi:hypothetical protein